VNLKKLLAKHGNTTTKGQNMETAIQFHAITFDEGRKYIQLSHNGNDIWEEDISGWSCVIDLLGIINNRKRAETYYRHNDGRIAREQ